MTKTKTKKPPGSFKAVDPKDRLPESVPLDLQKEMSQPAGIILRAWKKGVLEIRGTQPGSPAHAQDIDTHRGWLVVGLNGKPVYSHIEVGDILKASTNVKINVVPPQPGDIPKIKEDKSKGVVNYDMSNPNPGSQGAYSPSSKSMSKGTFRPGDKVEVYYGQEDGVSQGVWYPAEVTAKLFDGSFAVTFETGEAAEGVAGHSMRLQGAPSPTSSHVSPRSFDINPNDRVEIFYGPDDDGWYPATIGQRHRDGSFTVHFDSGEISEGVSREYIRPLGDDEGSYTYYGSGTYGGASSMTESLPPHLGVNSQAEVLWEGKEWTPCVIKAFHPLSNTYDVDWQDGTETLGVLQRDVRPAHHASSRRGSASSPRSWR
eukprot:TRINITY_DN6477_c0_g1_i2.p1 TRINITY_DN6477_c0_g1~~TRINITY_DN6477_c0_g1_i2.p1  ORF type:complete len:386 (+),score=46.90 TRINITY_DN6477_c0_g1_i2:44-1159(+)